MSENRDVVKDHVSGVPDPLGEHLDRGAKLNTQKKKSSLDVQVDGNHYKTFKIQPVEFCEKNKRALGYCQENIIKYACRMGTKGGAEGTKKDAEKIKHYVDLFLELNGYNS